MYYYAMTEDWNNKISQRLFAALLKPKTIEEMAAFCRDLMTEPEIKEFAGRWEVAQLLDAQYSQRQVAAKTGVSLATVTRVNQWLLRGMGGYKLVLGRIGHKHHTLSADAAS